MLENLKVLVGENVSIVAYDLDGYPFTDCTGTFDIDDVKYYSDYCKVWGLKPQIFPLETNFIVELVPNKKEEI